MFTTKLSVAFQAVKAAKCRRQYSQAAACTALWPKQALNRLISVYMKLRKLYENWPLKRFVIPVKLRSLWLAADTLSCLNALEKSRLAQYL